MTRGGSRLRRSSGTVAFTCNICETANEVPSDRLGREVPSCAQCGSTVRFRAVADLVAREVLGLSSPLTRLPERRDVAGVGLSDWEGYAEPLAARLSYTNTFFHTEPRLDVTAPPDELAGSCRFVIASEVLEHIPPPVERGFAGLRRLLAPGGVAIVTVPWRPEGETEEHFPRLHRWRIVEEGDRRLLENETAEGERETFEQLVFHGGDGATLEMRVFSRDGLLRQLRRAGFVDVRVRDEENPRFGIVWREPWSLPVSARAPGAPRRPPPPR